jgi:hypothetical protein
MSTPSDSVDDGINCSRLFAKAVHVLVNHLQQLTWLYVSFTDDKIYDIIDFPGQIRQQLHDWPLSRFHRQRCLSDAIEIWL